MKKIWQVLPAVSEEFIKKYPRVLGVVLQLLYNRGLTEEIEIENFLQADFNKESHDPFLFKDMEKAVALVIGHIKAGNKIMVYGDYDADGVTAAAILAQTLEIFKANVDVYIPYRVTEGYGLNQKAMETIVAEGSKLMITVDTGIRNKTEIEYIKSQGVDVIVTDHHIPPEDKDGYPDCLIIDAHLPEEKYPFKFLAGAGVAFKLAQALIHRSTLDEILKQKIEEQALDLVAIGTIADIVILLGENRVLTKKGLEVARKSKRVGLIEMAKTAQINQEKMEAWNIGFQIGPRINAAGRMDHANTAYELLITKDPKEAEALAQQLNDRNFDRQKITEEIVAEVEKQIGDEIGQIIIGICPPEVDAWNEGVVGLVAGKISEKYYRPVLIITKTEEGYKGSGRSVDEFNLIEAIEESKEFLEKYGGHPRACGFSLSLEQKDGFIKKITQVAEDKLKDVILQPKIIIESEIKLSDINEDLIKELEKLAPYGQGNNKPKFVIRQAQIKDKMTMGVSGQHIKLRFNGLWGIAFGMAEEWQEFKIGDTVDAVCYLEVNEFNGRRDIQLKLIDIKRV